MPSPKTAMCADCPARIAERSARCRKCACRFNQKLQMADAETREKLLAERELTAEELEVLIARQRAKLPKWWARETPKKHPPRVDAQPRYLLRLNRRHRGHYF